MPDIQRKHTKVMGKILVAGTRLTLRGPGEKPSWGETRSNGTGDSHPGKESGLVSRSKAHIPQSVGTNGNQEGWPSWVECRSGRTGGSHPGVDIFQVLSFNAKTYCGVKCSQGFHCTSLSLFLMERKTVVP